MLVPFAVVVVLALALPVDLGVDRRRRSGGDELRRGSGRWSSGYRGDAEDHRQDPRRDHDRARSPLAVRAVSHRRVSLPRKTPFAESRAARGFKMGFLTSGAMVVCVRAHVPSEGLPTTPREALRGITPTCFRAPDF